jgi:hypothetical protein
VKVCALANQNSFRLTYHAVGGVDDAVGDDKSEAMERLEYSLSSNCNALSVLYDYFDPITKQIWKGSSSMFPQQKMRIRHSFKDR